MMNRAELKEKELENVAGAGRRQKIRKEKMDAFRKKISEIADPVDKFLGTGRYSIDDSIHQTESREF